MEVKNVFLTDGLQNGKLKRTESKSWWSILRYAACYEIVLLLNQFRHALTQRVLYVEACTDRQESALGILLRFHCPIA